MKSSNMPEPLQNEGVALIQKYIKEKYASELQDVPLGTRIFCILEKKCTVIYYPIEHADEKNDAFLLSRVPMRDRSYKDIVFINTYQTLEKQVFAAAHELGHLTGVVEYVHDRNDCDKAGERIVSRFAAELLMPEEAFRSKACEYVRNLSEPLNFQRLLNIIVKLMGFFTVPYNAVVIRMFEVGILRKQDCKVLVDGDENITPDDFRTEIQTIISRGENSQQLLVRSMVRKIDGLKELLDKAEEEGKIPQTRIDLLRKKFDLLPESKIDVLEHEVQLKKNTTGEKKR